MIIFMAGCAARQISLLKFGKVPAGMAAGAGNACMTSHERIMCFRMIEAAFSHVQLLPSCRRMAFLAFIAECAFMMVFMAVCAFTE